MRVCNRDDEWPLATVDYDALKRHEADKQEALTEPNAESGLRAYA